MCRYKKFRSIPIIMLVFFGFSSSAYPAGNLHIGALEIHPFASVEQKYNDNIFLEPENQEDDDWITTTILGFGLKMPLVPDREEDFILKLKYDTDFIKFWDYTKQDRFDHNVSAVADLKFASDLTLKIEDKFQKTADPPNSELTALEKRLRNSTEVVFGYIRERIGLDLGYENIRDDYNNLNSLDKYEHVITTTGYYQLFPKTSIFGEYNYGKVAYDDNTTNSDSKYHQWRLGVKGDIFPKLVGVVKAGYKTTDYEDSTKDDFKGFTIFGNLTYSLKERSTLNIYGEREVVESTYSTNNYFEANKLGVKLDHQLLERLFLVTEASSQLNKYIIETTEDSVTAKRKDYLWGGKVGLRYETKDWLTLETIYEYKQRDSKFATFDYKNNIFSSKVSLLF